VNTGDVVPGTRAGQVGRRRRCESCGASFTPKRAARRQFFCSDRCRDAARRGRNFELFGQARRGSGPVPRSNQKTQVISEPCKGDFGDRAWRVIAGPQVSEANLCALPSEPPPAFSDARNKAKSITDPAFLLRRPA
jgi:hypothetical protein